MKITFQLKTNPQKPEYFFLRRKLTFGLVYSEALTWSLNALFSGCGSRRHKCSVKAIIKEWSAAALQNLLLYGYTVFPVSSFYQVQLQPL